MNPLKYYRNEEIERIIKLVRDKSLIAMKMSGDCVDRFNTLSATQHLEKLRLLHFSRSVVIIKCTHRKVCDQAYGRVKAGALGVASFCLCVLYGKYGELYFKALYRSVSSTVAGLQNFMLYVRLALTPVFR